MLLKKPKSHTIVDMYRAWMAKALKENPDYFTEQDTQVRWKGIRIVYQKTDIPTMIDREYIKVEAGNTRAFQTIHKDWVPNSIEVTRNGKLLSRKGGVDKDYYIVPGKHMIVMTEPPKPTDIISVRYAFYDHQMIMSYIMFRYILETYLKYGADAIIEGHRFDLFGNLGYLFAARIERSFKISKINVYATLEKRKEDPTHPVVYYTSPDYCRIKWHKKYRTRNESVYTFITAKTKLRKDFSDSIKNNPVLERNYKFYPIPKQQSA